MIDNERTQIDSSCEKLDAIIDAGIRYFAKSMGDGFLRDYPEALEYYINGAIDLYRGY